MGSGDAILGEDIFERPRFRFIFFAPMIRAPEARIPFYTASDGKSSPPIETAMSWVSHRSLFDKNASNLALEEVRANNLGLIIDPQGKIVEQGIFLRGR